MSRETTRLDIEKADFYKKGFWICFIYVIWDTLRGFGWL